MPGSVVSWSAVVRRLVFRQSYRAHIRTEQKEFLREHPELKLGQPVPMYLLWCADCIRPAPDYSADRMVLDAVPFVSAERRARWASEHNTATGHIHWHVIDLPGTTDRTENDR